MGSGWVSAVRKYGSCPLAVVAAALCALSAVDSQPVKVVAIQSALRITVEATVGGLLTTIPVQLEGISLIGPHEYSTQKITELCPPDSLVILQVPGPRFEADAFGITKAWKLREFPGPVDPAAPPAPAGSKGTHRSAIQVELMRAGWAVPEEAHPGHGMPPQMMMQTRTALEEARTRRMGAYSLPGFVPPAPSSPRRQREMVSNQIFYLPQNVSIFNQSHGVKHIGLLLSTLVGLPAANVLTVDHAGTAAITDVNLATDADGSVTMGGGTNRTTASSVALRCYGSSFSNQKNFS